MLHFREHRGGLADSMKTMFALPDLRRLKEYVRMRYPDSDDRDIEISYYGFDSRINLDNWIVTIKNVGVIGFITETD